MQIILLAILLQNCRNVFKKENTNFHESIEKEDIKEKIDPTLLADIKIFEDNFELTPEEDVEEPTGKAEVYYEQVPVKFGPFTYYITKEKIRIKYRKKSNCYIGESIGGVVIYDTEGVVRAVPYKDCYNILGGIIVNNDLFRLRFILKNSPQVVAILNNKITQEGNTLLHIAASYLNSEAMLVLKRYGAIEQLNEEEDSPLYLFLDLLIEKGQIDRLKNILNNEKALKKAKKFRNNGNLFTAENKEVINLLKEKGF